MTLKDISFDLPPHLIAQRPSDRRGEDRLLVLSLRDGSRRHLRFCDIVGLLEPGTVVVVNDSKVRKCRLELTTELGRSLMALFSHSDDGQQWLVMLNRSSRRRLGERLLAPGGREFILQRREGGLWIGRFDQEVDEAYFEVHGHVPLPPYIRRADEPEDAQRYQTVYACTPGSAASPTAGLHFTHEILAALEAKGVLIRTVTLHVGLGTFLPIRVQNVLEHRMHREEYEVPPQTAEEVNRARAEGRAVLAVGTTSLRTLEAATDASGKLKAGKGSTDLYIVPGYTFRCTRFLLTNFHTPGSTLLLLVAALAGLETVLETYQEAVRLEYRFFSYGDAMLFDPR